MADHWEIVRSWKLKVETNLKTDNEDEAEVWLLMSVKFNVESLWRNSCDRMNIVKLYALKIAYTILSVGFLCTYFIEIMRFKNVSI